MRLDLTGSVSFSGASYLVGLDVGIRPLNARTWAVQLG